MKYLNVQVVDKIARYQLRDGSIVCDNKNEYKIKFTFDEEWDDHDEKFARFIWRGQFFDQDFTGDECPVPKIVDATELLVGVYAGDLSTTTSARIPCVRSVLSEAAVPSVENDGYYENKARAEADRAEAAADRAATDAVEAVGPAAAKVLAEVGVVQEKGSSVSAVMSQKAVTDELNGVESRLSATHEQDTASLDARVSRNDKRITNLEQGLPAEDFVTDSTAAYVRDVPANALPFAEVEEIGGLTRKCNNLVDIPDTTHSGTTAYSQVCLGDFKLPSGTYAFSAKYTHTGSEPGQVSIRRYKNDVENLNNKTLPSNTSGTVNVSFTIPEGVEGCRIYLYSNVMADAAETSVTLSNIMLNTGDTALPYEPYFEGLRSAPVTEVVSVGANLFDYDAYLKSGKKYSFPVIPNKTLYRNAEIGYGSGWSIYDKSGALLGTFETFNFTATKPLQLPTNASYIECTDASLTATLYIGYDSNTTYRPYIKRTLSIPEAVQALPDYGIGIPDTDYFNRIRWRYDEATDKWVREYVKRAKKIVFDGVTNGAKMDTTDNQAGGKSSYYAYLLPETLPILSDAPVFWSGEVNVATSTVLSVAVKNDILKLGDNPTSYEIANAINAYLNALYVAGKPVEVVYVPAEHTTEDISDILPEDNLVGVQAGGTMKAENEFGYDVPMTVTYQIKEATV